MDAPDTAVAVIGQLEQCEAHERRLLQIKTRPPTFALWVARPKELPPAYRRYIINGLAKDFGITGVPIRLLVRTSKNPYK